MINAPASGERSALRGYRWQYDHIAARVYDALLESDLVSVRLTDPEAGRIDDLLLVRHDRVDAYQFKSAGFHRNITFSQVVSSQRSRKGDRAPSLMESLAEGWNILRSQWNNVSVHLVTEHFASVHDHLSVENSTERPSPDHFSAFLAQVLHRIRSLEVGLSDIGPGWQPALTKVREAGAVLSGDFELFIQSLQIDVGAGSGLPPTPSTRRSDIIALSVALQRLVSQSSNVVVLDTNGILTLMGWENRPRLRSRHESPVDLDTYEPLSGAIEQLSESITAYDRGYFAVIGPPGSGKSTLLSQVLSSRGDRIVRYYAYVPGTARAQTRLSARGFLHDLLIMLRGGGKTGTERELPSADIEQLRGQFIEQLDAASAEFQSTQRRTIIVVDGLDHVDRDYPGSDGLLNELPRPDETPQGVLFLVGSRTITPLHAYARQQIDERQTAIDLQHHRLLPGSILRICRRASVTNTLSAKTHQRIVELSNGHPLALSYVLNRLRDADGEIAEEVLKALPAYGGDVAAEYLAVWDEVLGREDIVDILAVCSRLRTGFTTDWICEWAPYSAVEFFRRRLLYLFRRHHDGWKFFHDSFRQFAADRTAWGDESRPDEQVNTRIHRRIADLCANTGDENSRAEQLYHFWIAERYDRVITLAQHKTFREQYQRMRSPELIREDIRLALDAASRNGDVLVMLRLTLALAETMERSAALSDVDIAGVLYDVGMVDEAIAWCGVEAPRVPLSQAYELAARLGSSGDPGGRRLFDLIEHIGFSDAGLISMSGQEDETALAWTRAASLFRPLPSIINRIRAEVDAVQGDRSLEKLVQSERWYRYESMNQELINAVILRHDEGALKLISGALADHSAQVEHSKVQPEDADEKEHSDKEKAKIIAIITDLRVRTQSALVDMAATGEMAEHYLKDLLLSLRGLSLLVRTRLHVAELCARHGLFNQATPIK